MPEGRWKTVVKITTANVWVPHEFTLEKIKLTDYLREKIEVPTSRTKVLAYDSIMSTDLVFEVVDVALAAKQ